MITVKPLSQRDPRWKSNKLGFGTGTIGSYGCLLVSYTVLLNYFIKKDTTPENTNYHMKMMGGYVGDTKNLWVWKVADKIWFTEYQGSFSWNNKEVLKLIEKGIPVIIKVDGKPIGGLSHYVLAVGDHKIMDPWTGTIEPFSKYKPLGYHIYTYKGGNMTDALDQCLAQHVKLVDEAGEFRKTISSQAKQLIEKDTKIKQLEESVKNLEESLKQTEALRAKWYDLYKTRNANWESCKKDTTILRATITKLENIVTPNNKFLKKISEFILLLDKFLADLKGTK